MLVPKMHDNKKCQKFPNDNRKIPCCAEDTVESILNTNIINTKYKYIQI